MRGPSMLGERVVLRNCGIIDPNSIEEYVQRDGYRALKKVLSEMDPSEVIKIIKDSGLRGRGGAGFPTGLKWELAAKAEGAPKFIICNADEGEPGTFKDRLILEGDPHSIIEGMAIAAYAVGATKGYLYIRGEYGQSYQVLSGAIQQATSAGYLGEDILGSGMTFTVSIRSGAGSYVCGEETALMESIEGKRGESRTKPPYPTDRGLWGRPTVINNVETLANIPPILENGAAWFRQRGTVKSPGTKVFTLTGDIVNRGLVEVPMGTTLRTLIFEVGGGIPKGRSFKMAQTGGSSGGCLPNSMLDIPLDFDSLNSVGSSLGSGALLIVDDSHCIVDVVSSFMRFFEHESCGKCTPCREGTYRLRRLVEQIENEEATAEDLVVLERLARVMERSCLCGLGQAAPKPILTTLKHFRDEYMVHIRDNESRRA